MFIGHFFIEAVHSGSSLAQVTCIKGGLSASYSSCALACQEAQKRKPPGGQALVVKAGLQKNSGS